MANKKESEKQTPENIETEEVIEENGECVEETIPDESFMKKLSEKKLEDKQKEIDELMENMKRIQAEFLNYKRRTEQEKEALSALANERIIMELLPVLDNFERGLESIEDKENPIFKGMELIFKQLFSALEKNGVKEIDTEVDFDPNFHHAVMQEEGEEKGKVLEVFQKGYLLKDKVIRPAMVKVSN